MSDKDQLENCVSIVVLADLALVQLILPVVFMGVEGVVEAPFDVTVNQVDLSLLFLRQAEDCTCTHPHLLLDYLMVDVACSCRQLGIHFLNLYNFLEELRVHFVLPQMTLHLFLVFEDAVLFVVLQNSPNYGAVKVLAGEFELSEIPCFCIE
jgi:hypothetical protein